STYEYVITSPTDEYVGGSGVFTSERAGKQPLTSDRLEVSVAPASEASPAKLAEIASRNEPGVGGAGTPASAVTPLADVAAEPTPPPFTEKLYVLFPMMVLVPQIGLAWMGRTLHVDPDTSDPCNVGVPLSTCTVPPPMTGPADAMPPNAA